jgi:HlyD family secretion protein
MPRTRAGTRRSRIGLVVLAALLACRSAEEPDAYGHIEATETVVAAQSSGQLEQFTPAEGSRLAAGAAAAIVDTSALALQLEQIAAQRSASSARISEASHHVSALDAQTVVAQRSFARARRLFAEQAATAQQLDQAEREYRTLVAQRAGAGAQREAAVREASSTDARVAQIRDQIARSHVTNPAAGTVLTTYVRPGEFVQVGQPLYKIANLDTMELRAYVTESQLAGLKLGQQARVSIDAGAAGRRTIPGVVTWISSQAEFTPTPIQTRDERTNLVYAVKLRLPNPDGALKIGMPADVELFPATAAR